MDKFYKIVLAAMLVLTSVAVFTGERVNAEVPTYIYLTNQKVVVVKNMNSQSSTLSTIKAGEYVFAKPVSKNWYYITSEKGYVLAKYLDRQQGQYKIVSSKDQTSIYEQASTQSNRLALAFSKSVVISYGSPMAGWNYIKYGDKFGYIQYNLLKKTNPQSMSVENDKGADLRIIASTSAKPFAKIPYKANVKVYSQFAGWAFVTSNYGNGYILAKDVTKPKTTKKQVAPVEGKKIALTFDDGPSASITPQVLKTLKKHNVKATFFALGQQVERYPNLAKQIVKEGHQIAGHSWNHRDLSKLNIATVKADLSKTNNIIKKVAGVTPTIYRPPYGALNNTMRNQISLRPILWTVDTLDWKHRNPNKILQYVKDGAKPGGNILMHDIHYATAAALEDVIVYLKSQGYTLVTVDQL